MKNDLIESLANMVIGAFVNWFFVLILFGVSAFHGLIATLFFFVLSFSRSFLIRRFFRWIDQKTRGDW